MDRDKDRDHVAQNQGVEFEREDLNPKNVFVFLIGLALVCVLIFFVLQGMYAYLKSRDAKNQLPQNPLVRSEADTSAPGDISRFPQPRLETNERLEINDFRMAEEQRLSTYGWVDQNAGVVRIPIERAMQLVAERGLPTRVQAGTTAPSRNAKERK